MKEVDLVQSAVLAGQILMAHGAETYRVEETMSRILATIYPGAYGVYATPTGIMASVNTPDGKSHATIRSVHNRGINLQAVAEVNEVSRLFTNREITIHELKEKLLFLENSAEVFPYPVWLLLLCSGVRAGAFTLLFGGALTDSLIGFFIGLVVYFIFNTTTFQLKNIFLLHILASFVVSAIAGAFTLWGLSGQMDAVIIGSLMLLVPGVSFTNAIRDMIAGDYTSGSARALEALLIATAIAIGSGIGLQLFGFTEKVVALL